jgi:hypothetical protein
MQEMLVSTFLTLTYADSHSKSVPTTSPTARPDEPTTSHICRYDDRGGWLTYCRSPSTSRVVVTSAASPHRYFPLDICTGIGLPCLFVGLRCVLSLHGTQHPTLPVISASQPGRSTAANDRRCLEGLLLAGRRWGNQPHRCKATRVAIELWHGSSVHRRAAFETSSRSCPVLLKKRTALNHLWKKMFQKPKEATIAHLQLPQVGSLDHHQPPSALSCHPPNPRLFMFHNAH